MTDVWSERAEAYRESDAHRAGRDLDLFAEWTEGETALDLRARGGEVVGLDFSEPMLEHARAKAPTIGFEAGNALDLPYEDGQFAAVTVGFGARNFADLGRGLREMARVSRSLVLLADNLFLGEAGEEADRLHDPTHVRNYTEEEWRRMFDDAGIEVEAFEREEKRIDFESWLERSGTPPEDAARARDLLADRIEDGKLKLDRGIFKGRVRPRSGDGSRMVSQGDLDA